MPTKFTQKEFLERLESRNKDNPNKKVFLYPKSQKYNGQNEKLQFRCEHKHIWVARPGNILNSERGCPQCKLINDSLKKRKPLEQVIEEFKSIHGDKYDYSLVEYKRIHQKVKIICPKHNVFEQTPAEHFHLGHECPKCAIENSRTSIEEFIQRANKIHNNKYDYSKVKYKNAYTKIKIICPYHGSFEQRSGDHLHGHGCKQCTKTTISYKQITWLTYVSQRDNLDIQHATNCGEYRIPDTHFKVDGYCKETNTIYEFHGDAFHGNPNRYQPDEHCHPFNKDITANELYRKTIEKEQIIKQHGYNLITIWESDFDKLGIPLLNFKYDSIVHVDHATPENLLNILQLRLVDNQFKGYRYKHNYQCLICGDIFETTLTQRKQTYTIRQAKGCPKCARNKKVNFSIKIQDSLQKEGVQTSITRDNVVLLDNSNVGVFISDFIQGVEQVNGKYFNLKLLEKYQNKHIRLLIFFQDEWIYNRDMIIKKILHISHKTDIEKIYARNCQIKQISSKEKSIFLDNYHIQGNDNSTDWFGAFHNNQLVACMTFSKPRIAVGKQKSGIELVRFTTKAGYHVIGIASKLLKTFERLHPHQMIYSFADRRWSVGNLYEKIGFQCEAINPPDYFYIVDGIRKHRWNYRKDVLKHSLPEYNPNITEYQNMIQAGYDRIWGCGTLRYVKLQNQQ